MRLPFVLGLCLLIFVDCFTVAPSSHHRLGSRLRMESIPQQPQGNPSQQPGDADEEGQAHTRFSKFAPTDQNLSPEDFRAELKENMKAELEKRRREDPNRGNQPAKSYLDSL